MSTIKTTFERRRTQISRELANQLQNAKRNRRLTQKQIALASGVSERTISTMLSNPTQSAGTLILVCAALGLKITIEEM